MADIVITLNRSDDQAKRGELVFYLEKFRMGPRDVAVRCITNYDCCITHEPGQMMEISSDHSLSTNDFVSDSGLETDKETSGDTTEKA
jgi:hypothetical protein